MQSQLDRSHFPQQNKTKLKFIQSYLVYNTNGSPDNLRFPFSPGDLEPSGKLNCVVIVRFIRNQVNIDGFIIIYPLLCAVSIYFIMKS